MNGRSKSGNRIEQIRNSSAYRKARAEGFSVWTARQVATEDLRRVPPEYPWLGELEASHNSTASGPVEGFTVRVRVVQDVDSRLGDDDVTGWFTDDWEPGCIKNTTRGSNGSDYKWYHPSTYDLTELPKDGTTHGMSKSVAADFIRARIEQAMVEDSERDYWIVDVDVELEGRTMGSNSLGGIDGTWKHDVSPYLRDVAVECMAEALDEARAKRKAELDRLGHWADEADYPVADWQAEVAADDTRLGYRQWVENQRLLAEDDDVPGGDWGTDIPDPLDEEHRERNRLPDLRTPVPNTQTPNTQLEDSWSRTS